MTYDIFRQSGIVLDPENAFFCFVLPYTAVLMLRCSAGGIIDDSERWTDDYVFVRHKRIKHG